MSIMHSRWGRLYRGTPAEQAIEPHVAALGYTYRTQFPMFLWGGRYFPDVAIFGCGVILEIDDESHADPEKVAADKLRTAELGRMGWRVVRCLNDEAVNTPLTVIDRINDVLSREGVRPIPLPPPGLPTKRKRRKR